MRRVFLLSSQSIFGQGVASLLRREMALEIIGQETDLERAIECIRALGPDVVIFDCNDPQVDPTLAMLRIFREGLGTKIIGLNLQDDSIYIYRREQRIARGVEDLLEAIEAG
jgi:DNA-binding NarL/FixJ family response regulator